MFFTKTASTLRKKELREAELSLVTQHAHLDYHAAMVSMYEGRIERLREEVRRDQGEAQEQARAAAKPPVTPRPHG